MTDPGIFLGFTWVLGNLGYLDKGGVGGLSQSWDNLGFTREFWDTWIRVEGSLNHGMYWTFEPILYTFLCSFVTLDSFT